jgi:serine/threonine-protein kinase
VSVPAGADAGEVRRVFDHVCDLDAAARARHYRDAGIDAAVVAEVESLLQNDLTAAALHAPVLQALEAAVETELGEGDRLGAWRLLRRLGKGGMGAVHLAERADGHFEQQAAVKLIRGFPGPETLAHFARERQILATLQHPCIARLLDGGATPGGQPYLVMEYVEGVPIDEHCEAHALDLRARLELFRAVCGAVQFAHQRLVVHCDLKPSNVLVRADGTPVLLDFGIARALDRPRLAEVAEASYFTPGYASPEQLRGDTLTTASDIYALGLILFELVAGRKARLDTVDRTVTLLARGAVLPSQVALDVPWRAGVAGDIDAIVLRATAGDPAARYASAQALADDVRRHLEHRPVLARPQTLAYRGARALRRRWPLALAAAAALLLAAGFTWRLAVENARARAAEREARLQSDTAGRVSDFLVSVFDVSNPRLNAARRDISAREVLDEGAARIERELAGAPRVKARLLDVLATAYRHLGRPRESVALFRSAVDLYLDPRVDQPLAAAAALSQLAVVYSNNAYPEADAEAAARRSLALRSAHAPGDAAAMADAWNTLGVVLDGHHRYDDAEAALQKALALRRSLPADADHAVASTLHNLGLVAGNRGDHARALDYFRQSLALKRAATGEHHPDFQVTLQSYAKALGAAGRPEQAVPLLQQNLALCRELYGERSAKSAEAHNALAYAEHDLGRFEAAIAEYTAAMDIHAEVSGTDSASYAMPLNNLAYAHEDMGDLAAAIPLYQRSLAIRRHALPDDDPVVLRARYNLARALTEAGRLAAARPELDAALSGTRARFGEDDANTAKCEQVLADWELRSRHAEAAAAALARLQRSRATFTPLMQARRESVEARIDGARGDAAAALEHHQAAWGIMRRALGERHPLVAAFALEVAAALSASGRQREARAIADAWRPLVEQTFAPAAPVRAVLARIH